MIKKISILSLFTLLLVFTGCEKCIKPDMQDDPFVNASDRSAMQDNSKDGSNGKNKDNLNPVSGPTNGGITDPNEGEDFDGIVDPDEDEDFDKDGK